MYRQREVPHRNPGTSCQWRLPPISRRCSPVEGLIIFSSGSLFLAFRGTNPRFPFRTVFRRSARQPSRGPPCLSRNNARPAHMGVSSGTARCVGGGSEEKRRRARMTVTWHRRGAPLLPWLVSIPWSVGPCMRAGSSLRYNPERPTTRRPLRSRKPSTDTRRPPRSTPDLASRHGNSLFRAKSDRRTQGDQEKIVFVDETESVRSLLILLIELFSVWIREIEVGARRRETSRWIK